VTQPLRLLTREDAAAAHALHALCFPPDEVWSAWAFQDTFALTTTLGVGAEDENGRLTGMIIVQKTPPDADILTMCVAPDKRRHGLAAHLLSGLVTLLGPYGMARLCLDVAADNTAAIKFYESSGFLKDGRRKNYYLRAGGARVDAILMSRAIAGHTGESEA